MRLAAGSSEGATPVASQGGTRPAVVGAAAAAAAPCPAANGWSGEPARYDGRASAQSADAGEMKRRERRRGRKRRLMVEGRAEEEVLEPRRRYQMRAHASTAVMTTAAAAMSVAPVRAAAVVVPVVLEAMAEVGVAMERRVRVVR